MKTEKIIWGLVLVFIGLILLLQNFGVIDFQWMVIWRFWPLILILVGANMLFSREDSKTGAIVSILLTVGALAFIGWQGSLPDSDDQIRWFGQNDRDDENWQNRKVRSNVYNEDFQPAIQTAVLNISGGATNYILRDSTSSLFNARVNSTYGNYSLVKTSSDSSAILNFKMAGKGSWNLKERGSNEAIISLNNKPVWEINVETGAGKTDFDLSAFKVRKITFQGGASTMDLKLGAPLSATDVHIETGVSKVRIQIPASAACEIKIDSGLSSSDFEGFDKLDDGTYVTPNYKSATHKMTLNLEGGLSKFEVTRY